MPIFSQFGEIVWKRLFNIVRILQTTALNNLQYSSQILKHLCDFPLPQCWFGYYSRLTAPKYAWLNIGEGEGQIKVRTNVSGVNVRNLDKIQDEWLLFQRFVIMLRSSVLKPFSVVCADHSMAWVLNASWLGKWKNTADMIFYSAWSLATTTN